jgi:hypothetical protein
MAKVDGDLNEWVKLPAGLCEKIVNGLTAPESEKDKEDGNKATQ